MKTDENFLTVGSNSISYKEYGQGELVFCLPPFLASNLSFYPLINLLQSKYKFVCLDLPAFGGYSKSAMIPNPDNLTRIVSNFIHQYTQDSYDILGYSFGGFLLLNALEKQLIHPHKSILVSTFYKGGDIPPRKVEKLFYSTYSFIKQFQPTINIINHGFIAGLELYHIRKFMKYKSVDIINDYYSGMRNTDLNACYNLIKTTNKKQINLSSITNQEILLLNGDKDIEFVIEDMNIMANKFHSAPHITLKNTRHSHLFFKPESSAPYIDSFLSF